MAYLTGKRAVELVREDLRPSRIMTRPAFLNAIAVNTAIGGSTNAPIHLAAIARHMGVELSLDDWEESGRHIPLLVNLMPAGVYLGEDFYHAGGVPAVVGELMRHGRIDSTALTVNGRTIGENCGNAEIISPDVIRTYATALKPDAGFLVMRGNLFDSAIMKASVISEAFQSRYLSSAADPMAFEGTVTVFDGPEDYHRRIDDRGNGITEESILVMRGAGPIGYPGAAEVVNMLPPAHLIERGVHALPCIGDGRQSGTSGSPSILNASPEAAADGNLALLRDGDRLRLDVGRSRVDLLISDEELASRRAELEQSGGYRFPPSQTPWQAIQRELVGQLGDGAILKGADTYQRIDRTFDLPRDSH